MTIQRAISLAGGFTERASRSKIRLMRENNPQYVINVDLNTPVKNRVIDHRRRSFFK